jgi:hypothetical protein
MADKRKSRAGRKPKPDDEKLSVQFMVRLTPTQADRLRSFVASRKRPGEEMSDVVRLAIDAYLSRD